MAAESFSPTYYGDRYHSLSTTPFAASDTAYTGAIDIAELDDETLNDDDSYSNSPPKSPSRPALSTRLLSSASPAAAAALTRSRTLLHSRARSLATWTSGLSSPSAGAGGANKLFGDFFAGGESVVRLGVTTGISREVEETEFVMDYRPALTQRSSFATARRSLAPSQRQQQQHPSDKSGWLFGGRKSVSAAQAHQTSSIVANDELLNLNINNALFPHGPADAQSPADFNELLLNATKLLERMQTSNREKIEYIASIQPEIEAQREEAEEAEVRAQHLKMQLEDMSRKNQEQEQALARLFSQNQRPTISRVVDSDTTVDRRRKRGSAGSASDSGFESDWDRDTESVTSSVNVHTPRTPTSAVQMNNPFDGLDQRLNDRSLKLQRQAPLRAINLGTFARPDDSTAAWNTVQQLRDENHDLRTQLQIMQTTLQGCIDFVENVHL